MPVEFLKTCFLALVRHALVSAGALLCARGVLQSGMQDQFIGAGMSLAGVIWSLGQKLGNDGAASTLRWIADVIDPPKTAAVAAMLFLAMLLVIPAPASAQTRRVTRAAPTIATVTASVSDTFTKLMALSGEDAAYAAARAKAYADAYGTKGAAARAACWGSIASFIAAQQASDAAAGGLKLSAGNPALITKAEALAEFFDAVSPDGPIAASCAPLANQLKTNVVSLISTVASGGLTLAAFGL